MGSPLGLDNTVTAGIISAKARRLPDESFVPFIQTDVAINPGNSGGPLFNMNGEVIAINSRLINNSGAASYAGISLAIPIDVAMKVKDQLLKTGKVIRGILGIAFQPVDADLAKSLGLEKAEGSAVTNVTKGSAADKAGLKVGDVILQEWMARKSMIPAIFPALLAEAFARRHRDAEGLAQQITAEYQSDARICA